MITDQEIEETQKEFDGSKLETKITFEMDALQLMAIHGVLCLGLRHPQYRGASRSLVLQFVKMAEDKFVEIGLMKEKHIRIIHQVEQDETERMEQS